MSTGRSLPSGSGVFYFRTVVARLKESPVFRKEAAAAITILGYGGQTTEVMRPDNLRKGVVLHDTPTLGFRIPCHC